MLNSAAGIANVTVGSASGGTFVLSVDGVLTAPIAFNALAADIEAALGAGTATVTGSGSIADPWVIIFAASPLSFSIDGSGLTQSVIDTSASLNIATSTATVTVGSASGGTFTLDVDGVITAPIAWNAAAADVEAAVVAALGAGSATVTGSGSIADPWVILFICAAYGHNRWRWSYPDRNRCERHFGHANRYSQCDGGSASGGSFTLTLDAATTAPIAFNALAADVEAAVVAALGAGSATVTGSGSIADPWVIVFVVAPAAISMDSAGLTQAVADAGVYLPQRTRIVWISAPQSEGPSPSRLTRLQRPQSL